MSGRLFDSVLVERKGYAFPVAVEYEKQPNYCAHCKMIGQTPQNCKKLGTINRNVGIDKSKGTKQV